MWLSNPKKNEMNHHSSKVNEPPIDAVIAWVDGSDPRLIQKRNEFLPGEKAVSHSGAHPTRFASVNEIRYCVLSILRFAPFINNLYIVTDGQDPNLNDDIRKYFPERLSSIRIVDHTEIFEGYEKYLPTFNSISIAHMIWRIKDLSDRFVYFNDDTFLTRRIQPEDLFVNMNPVLRGNWVLAPFYRPVWEMLQIWVNKYFLGKADFMPRVSFKLGQWNSAALLGFKYKYFKSSHTPHTVNRKVVEEFFARNREIVEKNLSYRFRESSQFTFIALSNHLQLIRGNINTAKPGLIYMQPSKFKNGYIEAKIRKCEMDPEILFMCVQSLEMCSKKEQDMVFGWFDKILDLK
jgi:hypothetical protein